MYITLLLLLPKNELFPMKKHEEKLYNSEPTTPLPTPPKLLSQVLLSITLQFRSDPT